MARIKHSGGLLDATIELGFDVVKYFEGNISSTASGFNISPPARRIIVRNTSSTNDVFLNVIGNNATTSVSFVPGDNIKVATQGTFTMDFDSLTSVSFITASGTAFIEGLLGFKGVK